jgi:glycosyltransferase involved in cell wall biosynthesis
LANRIQTIDCELGPKVGSRNLKVDLIKWPVYGIRLLLVLVRLRRAQVKVVVFQFKKEQILGSPLARMLGLRVIWVEHGPPHKAIRSGFPAIAYRLASRLSSAVIVPSIATRKVLEAEMGVTRVRIIHHGIDVRLVMRRCDALQGSKQRKTDRVVITNVCRLSKDRGHEVFIEASRKIHDLYPDVEFWIVGDGPEMPAVEARLTSLGANWITLWGEAKDVLEFLCETDIFVSSSYAEGEGLPIRILEAMAVGLPTVATDIGGTSEALGADGGILVPPRNSDALAGGIERLISDRDLRVRLGTGAQARALALFNVDDMLTKTSDLLREVA